MTRSIAALLFVALVAISACPGFATAATDPILLASSEVPPDDEEPPEVKPWEDELLYSELMARRRIRTGVAMMLGAYGASVALMGIRLAVLTPIEPHSRDSLAALVPFGAVGLGGLDILVGALVPTITSFMPEGPDEDALIHLPGGIFLYTSGVFQIIGLVVTIVGAVEAARIDATPRTRPWKPPPLQLVPQIGEGRVAMLIVAPW